jgi:hypothetical protein
VAAPDRDGVLHRRPADACGDCGPGAAYSTLQVKLGLVVLVGILIGAHMRKPEWHVLDAALFAVSLAIVWLGIVVAR